MIHTHNLQNGFIGLPGVAFYSVLSSTAVADQVLCVSPSDGQYALVAILREASYVGGYENITEPPEG